MPISVSCPKCNTTLKAPDSAAGRKVRCPKCSTPFPVPAGDADDGVAEAVDDGGVQSSAPPRLPARHAAPPSREEDHDYADDAPLPRRRPMQRQAEGAGTGLQMGLGIASLSVGAGGLVIAMIPCVGFIPGLIGAGTGLVLGLVGLIIATTQQNRGIAFPIAGSATSVVGLGVAFLMWMLVYRAVSDTVNFARDMNKQAMDLARDMKNNPFQKGPDFGNPFPKGGPNFGNFGNPQVAAQKMQSVNNLKQIGLALHSFNDTYRSLPFASGDGMKGPGKLSWRVAILPFLEQRELYNQFNLKEAWDHPQNIKLLDKMPPPYRPTTGFAQPGHTYYQVFTGPNTPFTETRAARIPASFPDGTSNTLLVVEGGNAVPWTKPEDLPFNRNGPLPRLGGMFPDGFNAAFADVSTRFIRRPLYTDDVIRDLIDPADGKIPNLPD